MKELQFFNKKFEDVVRHELLIYDRPLTEEDALVAYDLDCSEFTFDIEDCDTLCALKNLDWLSINVGFEDLSFLKELPKLEELSMEFYRHNFNFSYLTPLKNLRTLFVSGGDISDFEFHNFEELTKLPHLEDLSLHEFGTVNLTALRQMPYLKGFFCGYANKVYNTEAISYLVNLEGLTLIDVTLPNIDFLRTLPSTMVLDLCGVNILENVDFKELERFEECALDDIMINGERVI